MKKYLFLGILLAWTLSAFSAVTQEIILNPSITLLNLKAIKVSESRGDELYLTVTEYPSQGRSSHQQFPTYPEFWPSNKLSQITNLSLWNKPLKIGQSVILLISLLEQDNPPINPDDLIGTVRIIMKNNNGKLESRWVIPENVHKIFVTSTPNGKQYKALFFGSQSQYEINFEERIS